MVTKFKHPSKNYSVYIILDPCHMLKLARNAVGSIGSLFDNNDGKIQWAYFHNLHNLQEAEGLKLANKFSSQHLQYEKHKMNVRLAAQTLSSSVADAIEFMDVAMQMPQFRNSKATVTFIRMLDRAFDILNSRNPVGQGYKQPLRLTSKEIWEPILKSTAEYLLSLYYYSTSKKNPKKKKFLSTPKRETFIIVLLQP